jgi:ERCC4-related helicase
MPKVNDPYTPPDDLLLGTKLNEKVPPADQQRQRAEVMEILRRLRARPGVILADEVGTGKTFVALAVAYSVATRSPRGPVIVMVPANLVDKWIQDLATYCDLYLQDRRPANRDAPAREGSTGPNALRFGVARNSSELLKLLDDAPRVRCHLIFLTQGALSRQQTDKWIRLALIAEALRRHARGKASRLIQVKSQIHRFLAELLMAVGEQRAQDLGERLWQELLHADPGAWKGIYNAAVRADGRALGDDPVPKAVVRVLKNSDLDLRPLAETLKDMPVRAVGGHARVLERLNLVRRELRRVEEQLWKNLLVKATLRSPLLVMDEAHHLKNPGTALAKQLQSPESDADLRTGDGAMANAFDRMLFLTATPFQLGHRELVNVLRRFGDVRWDRQSLGERELFLQSLEELGAALDNSQRSAIALQRAWSRLRPEDGPADGDPDSWWQRLRAAQREELTSQQAAALDAYSAAERTHTSAETALRPWVVRHNKEPLWPGTAIVRRRRYEGGAIAGADPTSGISIPGDQLLPFFLAARSAVNPGKDLLGEALSSSFEAFRFTRQDRRDARDDQEVVLETQQDLSHAHWYLEEFDRVLGESSGSLHPKVAATVKEVVDLWEAGEKVLVFAFYRRTCRALRVSISQEIQQRYLAAASERVRGVGQAVTDEGIQRLVQRAQDRYFDDKDAPGRRALDAELDQILRGHANSLSLVGVDQGQRNDLVDVMRRYLRVASNLARCFPLGELDSLEPEAAVLKMLDFRDASSLSWRQKFDAFLGFLSSGCSVSERPLYIEAALGMKTGGIRVSDGSGEAVGVDIDSRTVTLATVQEATGDTDRETRQRLMRAFNTPFFPEILVCSEVMGEGVDLQRFCRHVIHHDLAWNPSTIEQRTGRVDRLGCKAQGKHPIKVFLPYLSGAADERQFKVMSDREQWFRVLMGQDEVARLITPEASQVVRLPQAVSEGLSFVLDRLRGWPLRLQRVEA